MQQINKSNTVKSGIRAERKPPVTLAPLGFDQAVGGLLAVKPSSIPKKPAAIKKADKSKHRKRK